MGRIETLIRCLGKDRNMEEVDEIKAMVDRGLLDEAFERALGIRDMATRAESLIEVARGSVKLRPELCREALGRASQWIDDVKDPHTRAVLLSKMAFVYSLLGENVADIFDEALDSASKIGDRLELGSTLAIIAYYLAASGFADDAYRIFRDAFEAVMSAAIDYRRKLDTVTEVAGLIESAGDELPSEKSVMFYEMAYDIFDKLRLNADAVRLEKKLDLSRTVGYHGTPEIRGLLLEGAFMQAVRMVEKRFQSLDDVFLALLEIALWMKKVNSSSYLDVLERAFSKVKSTEELDLDTVEKSVVILTEMGELKRALSFTMKIRDPERKDQALAAIALELAGRGSYEGARKVAYAISDMKLKNKVMDEIASEEGKEDGY